MRGIFLQQEKELISIYITGKRIRRNTAHTDGKDAGGELLFKITWMQIIQMKTAFSIFSKAKCETNDI